MPDPIELVRGKLRAWHRRGLLGPGVVVAVSGGGDSVALLRLLHEMGPELNLNLTIAHLNHGVRGEAADADVHFVADLAAQLDLPFELGHWSPSRAAHFESDARHARQAWLIEIARKHGTSTIALGHTRDDQAETILHRIVRGTGLRGLSGMPARRSLAEGLQLIRPLLAISRSEIRSYLINRGQDWREDATNEDTKYTRSRIRHDLMPKLAAEYNPRVAEALVRLGQLARAASTQTDRRIARRADAAVIEAGPDGIAFLIGRLKPLPPAERAEVIRHAWRRAGWGEGAMTLAHWQALAALVGRDQGRMTLPGGIDVWLSKDVLHLRPAASSAEVSSPPTPVSLDLPGSVIWEDGRIIATLDPEEPCQEQIDFDALQPFSISDGRPQLWVRAPRTGDSFDPLGLKGHSQSLNDFFRGRGIARADRARVPLLYDRVGIIWVVGHRIAERVKRTEQTVRTLGLRWVPVRDEAGEAIRPPD